MPTIWSRCWRLSAIGLALAGFAVHGEEMFVYFGTYTGGKSQGIYCSRFNDESGVLSPPRLAAATRNPSFVALHPSRRLLYAVGELNSVDGQPGGAVTAFALDASSGRLTQLNHQSSRGGGPCHLTVDATGRWVLVANYGGGSVAVLPIREDGSLGEATCFIQHEGSSVNPRRQKEPHAHSINLDPANHFAFVADLGLDKVLIYRFDATTGSLAPNDPAYAALPPGSGPRHFAFHPDGREAFVINELLSTITTFHYRPRRGVLEPSDSISTLPSLFTGENSTAEVQVHPSGRFVYGSNRGHNSLAVYRFDRPAGRLDLVEHESTQGRTPRNFAIDPTGKWLLAANQDSDSVVVFKIDPSTGALEPNGPSVEVGKPVCVKLLQVP